MTRALAMASTSALMVLPAMKRFCDRAPRAANGPGFRNVRPAAGSGMTAPSALHCSTGHAPRAMASGNLRPARTSVPVKRYSPMIIRPARRATENSFQRRRAVFKAAEFSAQKFDQRRNLLRRAGEFCGDGIGFEVGLKIHRRKPGAGERQQNLRGGGGRKHFARDLVQRKNHGGRLRVSSVAKTSAPIFCADFRAAAAVNHRNQH
jgi:hypothetical protein